MRKIRTVPYQGNDICVKSKSRQRKASIPFLAVLCSSLFLSNAHGSALQRLNDIFFPNPAKLALTKQVELTSGITYINPTLEFTGSTPYGSGKASSSPSNYLPYGLLNYRMNDKLVLGANITPVAYGHVMWPQDSFVAPRSTQTVIIAYRAGLQASYNFTEALAIGVGVNAIRTIATELSLLIQNQGNLTNTGSNWLYNADIGLLYKINRRNSFNAGFYSKLSGQGWGQSTFSGRVNRNFSINVNQAPVAFAGLQHVLTPKWFLEETIWYSMWHVFKNLSLQNTVLGTFTFPTEWNDTWSFQINTKYAVKDNVAVLGGIIYETNPAPLRFNSIAYPVSSSMILNIGLDLGIDKNLSTQLIYGYGFFTPDARLNNQFNVGTVKGRFPAFILQFKYKS